MTQAEKTLDVENSAAEIVAASLQNLKELATLPATALKIMRLAENPNSVAEDFNHAITTDPALSTRVLKVINSSFYGMSRQIDSIHQAVVLLGLSAIKNISIAGSVHKVFQADRIGNDFNPCDLWSHSVAVATGTRVIACKIGFDSPDKAFLAGMIHDLGIMVEVQACRPKFIDMIEILSKDQRLTFRQAEEQALGATHEAFGVGLCRKWKFPVHLEHVAGCHHQPTQLPEANRTLPMIVHVADILAARIGAGYTRTVETDVVDPEVLSSLNLSETDLEAITETLPDAIEETQRLFSDKGT